MRASGNGDPDVCVRNLLRTIRGEVPYERIKGIDRTLIDRPSELAVPDLTADVRFVIGTYEPRVSFSAAEVTALAASVGSFELGASIRERT